MAHAALLRPAAPVDKKSVPRYGEVQRAPLAPFFGHQTSSHSGKYKINPLIPGLTFQRPAQTSGPDTQVRVQQIRSRVHPAQATPKALSGSLVNSAPH